MRIDFSILANRLRHPVQSNESDPINRNNIDIKAFRKENNLPEITKFQPSSVIIPFYKGNEGDFILLTRRSRHLKSHPGQIGFPGGVQEDGESLLDTALREWEEEMGTPAKNLEVIGRYHDIITVTGYKISSFVAVYDGSLDFQLSEEVESAFLIPFSTFWNTNFYCIDFNSGGRTRVYYFDLDERGLLWGATCEIIYHFLKDMFEFDRIPDKRIANLPNPPFLKI